jgi:predicted dehydrogenase
MTAAGATAFSFTLLEPRHVRGTAANSKIKLGMIGCGGRGAWITDLFLKHGGYEIVGAHDYFQDRLDSFGKRFNVSADRMFAGLSGYKRVMDLKPEAVAIESPPYFHPEQTQAATDAGAHIYLAKPAAVDVWGCGVIDACAKKSKANKRAFLVDFQTRTDPFYQEAIRRTQAGEIGRIVCGESTYIAGSPFERVGEQLRASPDDPEVRLRAWGLDRVLSGDIITEQNIHTLDVATWVLDAAPVRAYGTGGRGGRDVGTCWDHFSVIFWFPKDVLVTFASKQFGHGWDDIMCRMYGTDGTVDTHYSGQVSIKGKKPYTGGVAENMYREGAVRNIATFYDDVTQGRFENPTAAPSIRSNLTTILGRMAAYNRREVTWDEMMKSGERWEADLKGLKD